MRKTLIVLVLLFCTTLLINSTKAATASGGELIYVHIQDSTYQFFVKLYIDCSGTAAPDSIPFCTRNTCINVNNSYHMQKWTGSTPSPIGPGCPNIKTTCDSPASTIPGYKEYWYSIILTLPSRCTEWKFFSYIANRNANSNNIQNSSSTSLYLEASFNNTISHNNSSPFFTVRPNPYFFQNQNSTFNMGASDADSDSLVTSIIHPRSGVSSCSDTAKSVSYITQSPPITIPTNPIQSNNIFTLNSFTGQTTFTPALLGKNNIAYDVKEYRNGVLIGSSMREMQIQVVQQNGSNVSTGFTIGCGVNPTGPGNKVYVCSGQTLSFCLDAFSSDTSAKLYMFDNKNGFAPTASISYRNQGTDTTSASFNWTPNINDSGPHSLVFTLHDSTCRLPGIIHKNYYVLDIYVWASTTASADTAICPLPGSYAQLNVVGGGNFSWTILPGGTPNSLNNTNIPNPVATPTIKTTYAVISNANPSCPDNKDTVTVDVLPSTSITNPTVNITVSPDSNILRNTSVTFTANVNGCSNPSYQWTINGINDPLGLGSTFTTTKMKNNDVVACRLTCNDTCPSPRDTVSNTIGMQVYNSIQYLSKSTNNIDIYPNPNNGVFNIKINNPLFFTQPATIEIISSIGQSIYKKHNAQNNQYIKLKGIPSGIYILKIRSGYNMYTQKFSVY